MRSLIVLVWLSAFLLISPVPAEADGLADLKAALAASQGNAPARGTLLIENSTRRGEGDSVVEESGQLSLGLELGAAGLQLQYSPAVLVRIQAEEAERSKNPKAKAPTLTALEASRPREMMDLLAAGPALTRLLDHATFKSERAENWNGKPARLLSFELGLIKLGEKDRKYVKKHEGSLDLWIGPDGTPLASRWQQKISARAFLVVSFETTTEEECQYARIGERLVTTRRELRRKAVGAGENIEERLLMTQQFDGR